MAIPTEPIGSVPRSEELLAAMQAAADGERRKPSFARGTIDDCGFSPFADDTSTAREIAFDKIQARVERTALAERGLAA